MTKDRPTIPLARLDRAVAGLRPMEREVLLLSAREGLSNDKVAQRLGISSAEAERLLATALCRLDRALDRQERRWWRPL